MARPSPCGPQSVCTETAGEREAQQPRLRQRPHPVHPDSSALRRAARGPGGAEEGPGRPPLSRSPGVDEDLHHSCAQQDHAGAAEGGPALLLLLLRVAGLQVGLHEAHGQEEGVPLLHSAGEASPDSPSGSAASAWAGDTAQGDRSTPRTTVPRATAAPGSPWPAGATYTCADSRSNRASLSSWLSSCSSSEASTTRSARSCRRSLRRGLGKEGLSACEPGPGGAVSVRSGLL